MALIKLEIYNFPRLRFFGGEMPLDHALLYNQMAKRSKAIQIAKHWYGRANAGNKRPFASFREGCGPVPALRSAS